MTSLVLDCSVAVAWCFEDEATRYTESILDAVAEQGAVVPSLWPFEVANVLLVAERKNRLTQALAEQFLNRLDALPIEVDDVTTSRVWGGVLSVARAHRLSSYDAAYLELAMRRGLPLATLDSGLRGVTNRCGVALFSG